MINIIMNSLQLIKDLIKTDSINRDKTIRAGNFVIFKYDAKDKTKNYDKTPLVFILWKSKSYMLGLNVHWCLHNMRKLFLNHILKFNAKNIKEGKPLEYDYKRLKPFLRKIGMFPVIRLYIRKRISQKVVLIPTNKIKDVIFTKTETFTGGIPDWAMYKKALKSYKKGKSR